MDEDLSKIKLVNIFWKNACRIYLKTIYISDISTVSEQTLTKGVLIGCDKHLPPSMLQWTN